MNKCCAWVRKNEYDWSILFIALLCTERYVYKI